MPELVEQMYCSQQIVIPPKFPYILKRYCKAAIKTQPYDLLRWSYEYFKALAERRPPPVKLRLEYPVYSTEGGLTRGCLKVLANQLTGQQALPLDMVKGAWQGFCLDPDELLRIFCLCEVYLREESLPFLRFIAVAAGMLTKSLTHTMILLCETLTKEPDGGSAAIPVQDFLAMYRFLANKDASKDVKYINGYKEGEEPAQEEEAEEEAETEEEIVSTMMSEDDYWEITDLNELQRVSLINDQFVTNPQLSNKINMPLVGKLERSPSLERAGELERANYLMERKEGPTQDEKINEKLRQMSLEKGGAQPKSEEQQPPAPESKEPTETSKEGLMPICVYNEEGEEIEYEIYGEDAKKDATSTEAQAEQPKFVSELDTPRHEDEDKEQMFNLEDEEMTEKAIIAKYVAEAYNDRNERRASLEKTFNDIATLVDKYNSAFYDLGMVAGRQMSTTSGEFIVSFIQRDIMAVIDEQIAVLPDPNLQKKKAKPEEKAMIREMLEAFLDENIQAIIPDVEVVQEEEEPLPEITIVYAVPGIGPPVDEEIMREFEEYALEACKVQSDVFMPRNIRHFLCPPLEKYVEINYDMGVGKPEVVGKKKKKKGEEKCVTGGGTIAE